MADDTGYVAFAIRTGGEPVMWLRTMTLDARGMLEKMPYGEAIIVFKPADIAFRITTGDTNE